MGILFEGVPVVRCICGLEHCCFGMILCLLSSLSLRKRVTGRSTIATASSGRPATVHTSSPPSPRLLLTRLNTCSRGDQVTVIGFMWVSRDDHVIVT